MTAFVWCVLILFALRMAGSILLLGAGKEEVVYTRSDIASGAVTNLLMILGAVMTLVRA